MLVKCFALRACKHLHPCISSVPRALYAEANTFQGSCPTQGLVNEEFLNTQHEHSKFHWKPNFICNHNGFFLEPEVPCRTEVL